MVRIESYEQGTPSYAELVAPDQQAAKEFYGRLFGWELADVPLGDAGTYVTACVGGDTVAGITTPPPGMEQHPAFWAVYLTVRDVDACAAAVAGAGGTVEAGPFDVMDLGRMVAVADPSGARVNLWQPGSSIGTVRANEPGTPIWHELLTPDVPGATAFYREVLGVDWEEMSTGEEEDYTCLVVDGRQVGGAMVPPMAGIPPCWTVYFNVEDVDATVDRATGLGGSVVAPGFDVAGVGRLAVLADPQGAMFNLMASGT